MSEKDIVDIGSDEWKQIRRSKITATDAPIIMGDSPWCTPLELYYKKVLGTEDEQNEAMKRGIALENEARIEFMEQTGFKVHPTFVISQDNDIFAASFDGMSADGKVSVEIKCPGKKIHEKAISGEVPKHYMAQLQHQMMVSGHRQMYYFSYHPGHPISSATIKVDMDPSYIGKMKDKEIIFYEHVQKEIPPPPSERDYQVIDSPEFEEMEGDLKRLMDQQKAIEEQIDQLRFACIEMAGNRPTKGKVLKFTPSFCKGTISWKSIPHLKGVDLENYRGPGYTKWTVRAVKEEDTD